MVGKVTGRDEKRISLNEVLRELGHSLTPEKQQDTRRIEIRGDLGAEIVRVYSHDGREHRDYYPLGNIQRTVNPLTNLPTYIFSPTQQNEWDIPEPPYLDEESRRKQHEMRVDKNILNIVFGRRA